MGKFVPGPCVGPRVVSRREMIQLGGSAVLGLNLPELLRADEVRAAKVGVRGPTSLAGGARALPPSADACILIFLNGGPSHLDMWDMKPTAPVEIRGPFQPIATTLAGVQVSEYLPGFAPGTPRQLDPLGAPQREQLARGGRVYQFDRS